MKKKLLLLPALLLSFGGVAYANGHHGNPCNETSIVLTEGNHHCQPKDKCPNLEGNQYTIPEGLVVDEQGNCVEPPVDVCPNIEGVQTEVPDGQELNDNKECVDVPVVVTPHPTPPTTIVTTSPPAETPPTNIPLK